MRNSARMWSLFLLRRSNRAFPLRTLILKRFEKWAHRTRFDNGFATFASGHCSTGSPRTFALAPGHSGRILPFLSLLCLLDQIVLQLLPVKQPKRLVKVTKLGNNYGNTYGA